MKAKNKAFLLHWVGLLLCIIPPVIATLEYFPLWFSQSETAISAMSAILLTLSCLPFLKKIKAYFRGSPASWSVWLVIWLITSALSNIIAGIETISFIALISNLLGEVLFRIERHYYQEKEIENG